MKDKLLKIIELVDGDELERDAALDLLRQVYLELKGKPRVEVLKSLYGADNEAVTESAPRVTLGDSLGLKRAIGLNERLLMIRDMFDGDAAAFDRAIARLEKFDDFDEAVLWLRDTFDWSAENRGAELLVELLQRKLGR